MESSGMAGRGDPTMSSRTRDMSLRNVTNDMSPTRDIHLLVILHGLWGSTKHLNLVEAAAIKASTTPSFPPSSRLDSQLELRVLKPESTTWTKLYDGIDVCASRVAFEVEREVEGLESGDGVRVREISVAGYSCGGLIAKYMTGILHARSFFTPFTTASPSSSSSSIPTSTYRRPRAFSCIATPHLGILYHRRNFAEWIATEAGWALLGRTGEQIYLKDGRGRGKGEMGGVLERMLEPEGVFVEALNLFPRVMFFANACQDRTVPYPTSTINLHDPFVELAKDHEAELVVEVDEDNIVVDWSHQPRARGRSRRGSKDRGLTEASQPREGSEEGEKTDLLLDRPEHEAPATEERPSRGRWSWRVGKAKEAEDEVDTVLKRPGSEYLPALLKVRWPWSLIMYAASPVLFAVGYPIAWVSSTPVPSYHGADVCYLRSLPPRLLHSIAVFVVHTLQSHRRVSHLTRTAKRLSHTSTLGNLSLREEGMSPSELEAIVKDWEDRRHGAVGRSRVEGVEKETISKEAENDTAILLDNKIVAADSFGPLRSRSSEETLVGDGGEAPYEGYSKSWKATPSADLSIASSRTDLTLAAEECRRPVYSSGEDDQTIYDTTLRLLPSQRRMVSKWKQAILNRASKTDPPREPVETYLTYYPHVKNAHAVICCRDLEGGLYPEQEVGRGVVRRWAERTVGA